ncbi:MAG TPA: cellulase family glycosylhydrolase [Candidatus Paceibacterota bacterium]|jgi:hypothetical protein
MHAILRLFEILVTIFLVLVVAYLLLSIREEPERVTYGMSFNALYANELGLNQREVYDAILDDLGVKHLRLAAHWTMIEPQNDVFDFRELDYQIKEAKLHNADVILAVGRRLPRWPECHVPLWAQSLPWEEQKEEIQEQIRTVVERYKGEEHIIYWQIENEPFLTVFAKEHCGELDREFLEEEIALVKEIDPERPVLVTDSGNLGTWKDAYRLGDAFGTSVYVYFWNPNVGPFKSILPASFYRAKLNLVRLLFGEKPAFLIELSAEPWLLQPVVATSLATQLGRMDIKKFEDTIAFARDTRFERQYLWGAEWWYWLTFQGYDAFWERGKELFTESNQ